MGNLIFEKLGELRGRVRRLTWLSGLSQAVMILVGMTLAFGLADWLIRINDSGIRFLFVLSIILGTGYVLWKFLIQRLLTPLRPVDVALRVETRYPGFKDGLASTVQFLESGISNRDGAPALQEIVIKETLAKIKQYDLDELIESRPAQRTLWSAVGVVLVAILFAGIGQAQAATALYRLCFPFSDCPWPKAYDLRFVNAAREVIEPRGDDPLRVARGDQVEFFVVNLAPGGKIPPRIRMEYRLSEDEIINEPMLKSVDTEPARTNLVARKSLQFRAVGGDDETDWYSLEVVPPPVLEKLQLTIVPPKYLGTPETNLAEGVGHFEAYLGTTVRFRARSNREIASCSIRIKDRTIAESQISEGMELSGEFKITEAGTYTWYLDLEDKDGFRNQDAPRYEIRAISDTVPEISFIKPASDLQVTPTAVVDLEIDAKDDLGIREISLEYLLAGQAPILLPLAGGEVQKQQSIKSKWGLEPLELKEGMQVTLHAIAKDEYDLGDPHLGRSLPRVLSVVSSSDKRKELAERQAGLVQELDRAFRIQRDAHQQIRQLQVQVETAGEIRPNDQDLIQRVEQQQRQISLDLFLPSEGLSSQIEQLQKEWVDNKLDDKETQSELNQLGKNIGELGKELLPSIEQKLTELRKQIRENEENSDQKELGGEIAGIAGKQKKVADRLEELLTNLSRWRDRSDVSRELEDFLGQEKQILKETNELGQKTLSKTIQELPLQEQADLKRLEERQRQAAERWGQFEKRLEELSTKLSFDDPTAATNIRDAVEQADQNGIDGEMRQSADSLGKNQIGAATREQQKIIDQLEEIGETLRQQGPLNPEAMIKRLKQLEDEVETLRKQQKELQEETLKKNQEKENLERLRKEQQKLEQKAREMARRLRRLSAERESQTAERAAQQMEQAAGELGAENPQQADDLQQEAEQDLEQLEREIKEARAQLEKQLEDELVAQLADRILPLAERQKSLRTEAERFEGLKSKQGNLNRVQLKGLRELTENQNQLEREVRLIGPSVPSAEVLQLILNGSADLMKRAAERLEQRDPGPEAQAYQSAAYDRLMLLVKSLQEKAGQQEQGDQQEQGEQPEQEEETQQNQRKQGSPIPPLQELKLLKALEEDLHQRTLSLEAKRKPEGTLSDPDQRLVQILSEDQARIVETISKVLARIREEQFDAQQKIDAEPEQPKPEPNQPTQNQPDQVPGQDNNEQPKAKRSGEDQI